MGVLATSRAIGDYELKPYVRAEPDVLSYHLHIVDGSSTTIDQNDDLNVLDVNDEDTLSPGFPTASLVQELKRTQCTKWSDRWLLLASDGFFEVFSNANAAATIRALSQSNNNMNWIAEELTKRAYARGSSDNITVILIDLYCTLGIR
jgi:serine/threonine protein phosphatase PrpC